MKFIDKVQNFLVLMNDLKVKYLVRSILKNSGDIAKVLIFEGPGTLNALNINQYCIKETWNILSWVTIKFYPLQRIHINLSNNRINRREI